MLLNDIFAKDVQRPIEGVIKADASANLVTEVEEYVLTNEAAKGVEQLLEAYTDYVGANGVWISGFFGSGKSHLLKMLAHLLGDVQGQAFPRSDVSRTFRAKAEDAFLPPLLDKAARIEATSLLFNIDQKATLISKDQTDALLKVFVKVFNEACGYFGNQGHVAAFERDLDKRGQYEDFKAAFERLAEVSWTKGREQTALEGSRIDAAFNEVSGQNETGIIRQYQQAYAVSIEDFAEDVKAWLDDREPGYRLNFFVDEVGQFIAGNTKLMLNLQTVAESLATKCDGRAWVFVTSQEDMDRVIGDQTKQQGNDFSKIQARFKNRIKLSSADVEEVISKRLLEKNDQGRAALTQMYAEEKANFKTLFDFVDGAKNYRNFSTDDSFLATYPFVNYQFPLFQTAIIGISDHNVFEGRNSSVGERSMLGVVQQVAKELGGRQVGALAPFDAMFEGIRSALKSVAQNQILVAERNLSNPLAIRLLKALFLVKYVDSFQATARNLTVLVYDRFGLDLAELSEQVKEALALLESQTYIQRNGEIYDYLTNEEQRIEEEIKNVEVDSSEFTTRLGRILSADVLKSTKLRYAKNGQDFGFGYLLDDQVIGRQQELSVHFITPETPYTPDEIRMHSAGKDELRVVMEPDERALADLWSLLRTEKYIKQKLSSSLSEDQTRILQTKASQNTAREKEIIERVRRAVGRSQLIVGAAEVTSNSQDPIGRVTDGFQDLINRTYTQLSLLGGATYTESQVASAADPDKGLIDPDDLTLLQAPADDVLSFIIRRSRQGELVTMKTVVDTYQAKPYGWDLAAIEVVVAHLAGGAKVALTLDGNQLKRTEFARELRNTQKHPHLVITQQKTYDPRKVANLRKFCQEFFAEANPPRDPVELARHAGEQLTAKLHELEALSTGTSYPFMDQLKGPIDLLKDVTDKPVEWYVTDFTDHDALLDAKDETIDPIDAFLKGPSSKIYDDAAALLIREASNLHYLPDGIDASVREALEHPNAFRGNRMNQLKEAANRLRARIEEELTVRRAEVADAIESRRSDLIATADYAAATSAAQTHAESRIDAVLAQVRSSTQIAQIGDLGSTFTATIYTALLDQLAASPAEQTTDDQNTPRPKQTIPLRQVDVSTAPRLLETEADVEAFIDVLRSALLKTLRDGQRVSR